MAGTVRRVLVNHKDVPKKALDLLAESCELVMVDGEPPSKEQTIQAARAAAALPGGLSAIFHWHGKTRFDAELLDAAGPSLRAASVMSAGLDHVDIDEFRKRGIALGNVRGAVDAAVADLAMGLILSATRRFHEGRRAIETGEWQKGGHSPSWMAGSQITNSTVGIVGFGGIGSGIARRLKGFQVARIVYSGRSDKPYAKELGAERLSLTELLSVSDIVVAACPLTSDTKGMFDAEAFKKMKREATFVNVGRGQLVEQDALIEALKTGQIFAAGLDVMTPEPLPPGHPLLELSNVILVPHLGTATQQTRDAMALMAARNILAGLAGDPMPSQVV